MTGRAPDAKLVRSLLDRVNGKVGQLCSGQGRDSISLMEVCGTHTMAISGHGIRRAVDSRLRLLSGPGCPVCVTTQPEVDAAIGLARRPGTVVATFGDMLRVPGARGSLEEARAAGADVRVVYSALDALRLAQSAPEREVVFLGVGFETTAPTVAAAVLAARSRRVGNFTVLPLFKLVPPALRLIAGSERVSVDGFLLPGHVSVIIGTAPYAFLANDYALPAVVAGFEAADIVQSLWMLLVQLETGPRLEIQYRRSVRPEGNPAAQKVMAEVFEPCDADWREIGIIPGSGLAFRPAFREFDAVLRFGVKPGRSRRSACRCGEVMLGVIAPPDCKLFARKCRPESPVGPCMVSSEGACAAWFKYEREHDD
ncbi:MAG: hydrogenase formation protein HypD [bacterium]